MGEQSSQVQQLLAAPPAEQQRQLHAKLTGGLGVEVRQDAGGGKGKGLFATQSFAAGDLIFTDRPLAAIQHTANRAEAWVCGHCFRFIASIEQQIARQVMAAREAGQDGSDAASDNDSEGSSSGGGSGGGSRGGDHAMQREAAAAIDEEQLEALAAGQLRLPHTDAFLLPTPVRCPGGCCEEWYCSSICAEAAWRQYHQLLCVGPEDEAADASGSGGQAAAAAGSNGGKGRAPAAPAANTNGQQQQRAGRQEQQAALQEFYHHADTTNDVFRLAAIVAVRVLLAAQQQLEEQQRAAGVAGSSGGGGSSSSSSEPSSDSCWQALLAAWEPFAAGQKGLWWECTAAPPEAAADMRQLAADSLELLTASLPPPLVQRFAALLTLPVWGSVIGMFELNNLSIYVASPVQRWLQHIDALPPAEQAEAYVAAGRFINALPEELPGCDGNAFYGLHSCCNHSCAPNAEAFKRDEDEDGSAVILALRDIQAGEEVTLSYIDEEASLEERREQLADYGFLCACDKCGAEELADELDLLG